MGHTLYTRALARAAEIQGSTQSLASLLRVPENTLLRWMAGRAQMPLQAFLKTLELISADERRQTPAARTDGAAQEKLRFRIGELEARCARCGGQEFAPTDPWTPLRYISELACCACGERVIHGDLIAQLAKEAVHHTKAATVARQRREAGALRSSPKLRLLKSGEPDEPQRKNTG